MEQNILDHLKRLSEAIRHRSPAFVDLPAVGQLSNEPDAKIQSVNTNRGWRSSNETECERREGKAISIAWNLMDERRPFIVEASGGSGKTTTLESLSLGRAQSYREGGRVCVLAYLDQFRHESLLDFLVDRDACPECYLDADDIRALAEQGRLELLLDGYDELVHSGKQFLECLEDFRRDCGNADLNLPVVISSRPRAELSEQIKNVLRLAEMRDKETQRRFVQAYFSEDKADQANELLEALHATPGGESIGEKPICLAMLCMISRSGDHPGRLPHGVGDLYRLFFRELYHREGVQSELFCGKRRNAVLPPEKFEQTRQALAALEFQTTISDGGGQVQINDAVRALEPVFGHGASDAMDLLLELPLFGRGRDHTSLTFFHNSFREYLLAEHVLHRPLDGVRLLNKLDDSSRFTLSCVFELADERFYPRSGKPLDKPVKRFVDECWRVDPLLVCGAARSDQLLRRLPVNCDNSWWRGVLQVLEGSKPPGELPETEAICEHELSGPPPDLLMRLRQADFWEAADGHGAGKERLDRLWALLAEQYEPWADLLPACLDGNPEWQDRLIGYVDGVDDDPEFDDLQLKARYSGMGIEPSGGDDPEFDDSELEAWEQTTLLGYSLGYLGREYTSLSEIYTPDEAAELRRRADEHDERFANWPDDMPRPDDELPPEFEVPDELRRAPPRLAMFCLLQRRFDFGHLLWFLQTARWFGQEDGISRRQWRHVWRWWDQIPVDTGSTLYDSTYSLANNFANEVNELSALTDLSPNIGAAIGRIGWVNADVFSPETRERWTRICCFEEALSLVHAGVFDRREFPAKQRIGDWVKQVRTKYDADHLIRAWPFGRVPWDAVHHEEDRERLLNLAKQSYHTVSDLLKDDEITWDVLPIDMRRQYVRQSLRAAASLRNNQGTPRRRYVFAYHGATPAPSDVTGTILSAIETRRLRWEDLLDEELQWLADPTQLAIVRRCVEDGRIRIEVLDGAPDTLRNSQNLQNVFAEKESLARAAWERLRELVCRRYGLCMLEVNRELAGGMSDSRVWRVYLKSQEEEVPRLAILKQTYDEGDYRGELEGYQRAAGSWLHPWLPKPPHGRHLRPTSPDFVILSELAFPITPDDRHVVSLHEVIQERYLCAARVLATVGQGYVAHLATARTDVQFISEHLLRLLNHWHKADWRDDAFWTRWELPHHSAKAYRFGSAFHWNPLWCATHDDWHGNSPERILFYCDVQHRDLNARNLLLSPQFMDAPDAAVEFKLIDFEKCTRSSAILDLCWLAFWTTIASVQDDSPNQGFWEELPRAMMDSVIGRESSESLGGFDFGLDLIRSLFGAAQEHFAAGTQLGVHLRPQLLTTLAAASLAKAFYEFRDLDRSTSGDAPESEEKCRHRRWGECFFQLSALAFGELIGDRPDEGVP